MIKVLEQRTHTSALPEPVQLTPSTIADILDYVRPNERVVLSAAIADNTVTAQVRFTSPDYTVEPVIYLNSAALCVSLAQTTHLLIDFIARRDNYRYAALITPEEMAQARRSHKIFFTHMNLKFCKIHSCSDYTLCIHTNSFHTHHRSLFATFTFNVEDTTMGSFMGCIPAPKRTDR